MFDHDTTLGGVHSRFPDTRRSLLADAATPGAIAREALIAAYWKPVYKYIRVQWRRSNEDAKDLTQTFFTRALEKNFFQGYDPSKARFRTYLRAALDNHVRSAHRAEARADLLSLDFTTAEGEITLDPPDSAQSMEDYFQQEWVRHLFELAVDALRRDYEERGYGNRFALFQRYDLDEDASGLTYQSLAAEFGIPATQVTNWLAAARRDFRRIVLDEIRAITAGEREFHAEVRAVLGIS